MPWLRFEFHLIPYTFLLQTERAPTLSRRTKKPRIAQLVQMRNELVDEIPQETISLNIFGGAGSVFPSPHPPLCHYSMHADLRPSTLSFFRWVSRYKYSPPALADAMELSEIEPPEDVPEGGQQGEDGKQVLYRKLRPDLQDSDLLLENSEEKCVSFILTSFPSLRY